MNIKEIINKSNTYLHYHLLKGTHLDEIQQQIQMQNVLQTLLEVYQHLNPRATLNNYKISSLI